MTNLITMTDRRQATSLARLTFSDPIDRLIGIEAGSRISPRSKQQFEQATQNTKENLRIITLTSALAPGIPFLKASP